MIPHANRLKRGRAGNNSTDNSTWVVNRVTARSRMQAATKFRIYVAANVTPLVCRPRLFRFLENPWHRGEVLPTRNYSSDRSAFVIDSSER